MTTTSAKTHAAPASDREGAHGGPAAARPGKALGQALGNQGLLQVLSDHRLQARLNVSRPDDPFEREAEDTAARVLRMPAPATAAHRMAAPQVQRLCHACEEELGRRTADAEAAHDMAGAPLDAALESRIDALRGAGAPLPATLRADMEPRFGADFSPVRIHTGSDAHELASAVQAQAFTVGADLVFAAGQFAPETPAGRHLIAHELTHVLQQGAAPIAPAGVGTLARGPVNPGLAGPAFDLQRACDPEVSSCLEAPEHDASEGVGGGGAGVSGGASDGGRRESASGGAAQHSGGQPPASGASRQTNPYAGTPLEGPWQQGFDDGFAQPEDGHPAPSPYPQDAQVVYAEGVLAGRTAAGAQAGVSRAPAGAAPAPAAAETIGPAEEGWTSGEIAAGVVGLVVVGAIVAGAVIVLSGGSLAAPVLALVMAVTPAAEAGLGGAAAVGTLEAGAEIALVVDATTAAPAALSAVTAGSAEAAATVAVQSAAATTAATTSASTVAAVVTVATVSATTLSSDSPQPTQQTDEPTCSVPLVLPLPAPKSRDLEQYADHIDPASPAGLAHIIGRVKPDIQRAVWWADMQVAIRPDVFARGLALGLTRDQVIFPTWSRHGVSTEFEVDHIIEYQVLPIGEEAWFDRPPNYRLMDKTSNAISGASLAAGIGHLRQLLANCKDARATGPFRFEGVAPTGDMVPEIWTRADIITGRHLDAYEAMMPAP